MSRTRPCEDEVIGSSATHYWKGNDYPSTLIADHVGGVTLQPDGDAGIDEFGMVFNGLGGFSGAAVGFGLSQTWSIELWATALDTSAPTTYSWPATSNNQQIPWLLEPPHSGGPGLPSDAAYGIGLMLGTNGYQVTGHRHGYLTGPRVDTPNGTGCHHFVISCWPTGSGGSYMRVYRDAQLEVSTTWDKPAYYPLTFGWGPYGTKGFEGSMRHLALYIGRNLTTTEIADHFLFCECRFLADLQPPLRQHQRDDGLATSAPRMAGPNGPTSRQRSVRQGWRSTYL